jgi:hypothetical protein
MCLFNLKSGKNLMDSFGTKMLSPCTYKQGTILKTSHLIMTGVSRMPGDISPLLAHRAYRQNPAVPPNQAQVPHTGSAQNPQAPLATLNTCSPIRRLKTPKLAESCRRMPIDIPILFARSDSVPIQQRCRWSTLLSSYAHHQKPPFAPFDH